MIVSSPAASVLPVTLPTDTPQACLQRGMVIPIGMTQDAAVPNTPWQVVLIDQRVLPGRTEWVACDTVASLVDAIQQMVTRGAPLLGLSGAYGIALSIDQRRRELGEQNLAALRAAVTADAQALRDARPTAVNLMWGVDQTMAHLAPFWQTATGADTLFTEALTFARLLHQDDLTRSHQIREAGKALMSDQGGILTICNTGALATGGGGTALGVILAAWEANRSLPVYACETRPRLQGARLTMWELSQAGVTQATLLSDNMAATLMREGKIQCVIAGADRITRNGDAANKIGTYMLAVLAKHHGVPFYIAAPLSTVDFSLETGESIHIEHRHPCEVTQVDDAIIAPPGVQVYNPAFDVTPAALITGIITEQGVMPPQDLASLEGEDCQDCS